MIAVQVVGVVLLTLVIASALVAVGVGIGALCGARRQADLEHELEQVRQERDDLDNLLDAARKVTVLRTHPAGRRLRPPHPRDAS